MPGNENDRKPQLQDTPERIERIRRLAKFIALATMSSGPDYSKRADLDELLDDMEGVLRDGNACMAYNVYGFFEREGWL